LASGEGVASAMGRGRFALWGQALHGRRPRFNRVPPFGERPNRPIRSMFSSPAFAQTAGAATGGPPAWLQFAPLLAMVVIFYFLLIRPQQTKMKQHRQTLEALKKGDTVVTGGGLIGRVIRVDGDEVEIELGPNMRVRAIKGTITDVRDGAKPAND
jgi:preprotein translocase subunit YajC